MLVARRAVLVSRGRVFLRLVMPTVLVVMRGLAVMMGSRFVMSGGDVMVFARRMLHWRHGVSPSGGKRGKSRNKETLGLRSSSTHYVLFNTSRTGQPASDQH
jgi:hypothetical protein